MSLNPAEFSTARRPRLTSPLSLRQSAMILGAVIGISVAILGGAAALIYFAPSAQQYGAPILAWALVAQSAASVVVIHFGLRFYEQSWRDLGFINPDRRLLHLLWQFPLGFLLMLAVQAVMFIGFGFAEPEDGATTSLASDAEVSSITVLAMILAVVILVPMWEEATCRGIIHLGIRRRVGAWLTSVASAAVFAAVHGVPILLPVMVPYIFTLGLILAFLTEFHRTLWAPLIFHTGVNAFASGGLALTVFA